MKVEVGEVRIFFGDMGGNLIIQVHVVLLIQTVFRDWRGRGYSAAHDAGMRQRMSTAG